MTNEEAIKHLKEITGWTNFLGGCYKEKLHAIDIAIADMEKQIPKKPDKEILTSNAFTQWRKYTCPTCNNFLFSGSSLPPSPQPYCHRCGQKLKWGEEE